MSAQGNKWELVLLAVVGVMVSIILYVWLRVDSEFNQHYDVPLVPLELSPGPDMVREGERQARIRGCFWCHGVNLEGQKYFAEANRGIIAVAPNLGRKVREYTPAEFARAVRHGVRPDGTSLRPAMPSFAFYNMSDADMAAIIAYIQSLPEQKGLEGQFDLLPVGWVRWLAGQLMPNVADLIDHSAPRPDPALNGSSIDRGRYLAESICTECHGDNGRLRVKATPDLEIAAAYTREGFFRLMRTGVPFGERKIDYHMVDVSKYRYTAMTDAEVEALYSYFRSLVPGLNVEIAP